MSLAEPLSKTALRREVRAEIASSAQERQVPAVLWAGPGESEEDFALRCARLQLSGTARILAEVPFGFGVAAGVQAVPFAPKLFWLLHPSAPSTEQDRVASGGRGSAKSHAFATAIVLRALTELLRILCCREYMQSLRESVHHLIVSKIDELGLSAFFEISERSIRCTASGAEIIFAGLHNNTSQLKSLEGVGLTYIEQAEKVSKESLGILRPTVLRVPGAQIWMAANPEDPEAPVQEYIEGKRPNVRHVHVIFSDNPWWPAGLEEDRLYLQRVDADAYAHIYLGTTVVHSEAQVFRGKYCIEEFEPVLAPAVSGWVKANAPKPWSGPYFGADWGFSVSPTVAVKVWISERTLYVEYEAYKIGCDINDTPALFDTIPGAREHTMRGDNARPETISYMKQNGYPKLVPCMKGKGSIEDGIAFMRGFERIVLHPRCVQTAQEFRLYSHPVDPLTGDVLPGLVDKFNDCCDAIRYSLEPAIKRRRNARITPLRI